MILVPFVVCSLSFYQTLDEQITRYFHDIGDPPEETLGELETAPLDCACPPLVLDVIGPDNNDMGGPRDLKHRCMKKRDMI